MKAVLEMELIADHLYAYQRERRAGVNMRPLHLREEIDLLRYGHKELRPWVARIVRLDEKGGLIREFINPTKDYSHANSIGSRGVYGYWVLSPGIYQVNKRTSWKHARRYFIRVVEDTITEISTEEALRCLKNV